MGMWVLFKVGFEPSVEGSREVEAEAQKQSRYVLQEEQP